MLSFLIYLLVSVLIFGLIWYLIDLIPVGDPRIKQIIRVILIIIAVIWLIQLLLGVSGTWRPGWGPY